MVKIEASTPHATAPAFGFARDGAMQWVHFTQGVAEIDQELLDWFTEHLPSVLTLFHVQAPAVAAESPAVAEEAPVATVEQPVETPAVEEEAPAAPAVSSRKGATEAV